LNTLDIKMQFNRMGSSTPDIKITIWRPGNQIKNRTFQKKKTSKLSTHCSRPLDSLLVRNPEAAYKLVSAF
jgi:hypothetical protein